jgi:TolA-binding protein
MPVAGGLCAGGGYSVQVALCENFDRVSALVDMLRKQGYDPFFGKTDMPEDKGLKRLCVGRYANMDQALECGERLRMKGIIDHFIVIKTGTTGGGRISKGGGNVKDSESVSVVPGKEPLSVDASTGTEAASLNAGKNVSSQIPAGKKLLEGALEDFASERYEDALLKLKKIEFEISESIQRTEADCHYFLGEKGDKQHASEAVDRYRNVIRNYPDSVAENMLSSYRLARSYSLLGLDYEALAEFRHIYADYPESEYASESLYMAGTILYKTEKFGEAAEILKEYIKKFPGGDRTREAYFKMGDCYSRMRQFDDANIWYDNALKKWPAPEDIPADALLNLGLHYVEAGRYENALDFLFAYINLFPSGDHADDALYAAARSFEGSGRPDLALKLFGLVIEKYPKSAKAKKSALMIADMGADDIEMKPATQIFAGMDCYENPIEVYDTMAMEPSDPAMAEEIAFRKEMALIKRKRYQEAFNTGCLLVERFPGGVYRKTAEENLMMAAKFMIEESYKKGDYISVVNTYLSIERDVLFESEDFDTLSRIGESLRKTGLLDHAALLFENMIRIFGAGEKGRGLLLEMARIDYDSGNYKEAGKRLQPLVEEESQVEDEVLNAARELMGDISCKEGLYKDAADFYSAALDLGRNSGDKVALLKKYADALKEMGMYSSAFVNYWRTLKGSAEERPDMVADLYEEMGSCLYSKEMYEESMGMYRRSMDGIPEDKRSKWTILDVCRVRERIEGEVADVGPSVVLTGEEGDEFWSKVLDCYGAGRKRTEEYGSYVQDS